MKIQVTFEDVVRGKRASATRCMVARAVQRQVPWLREVRVGYSGLHGVSDDHMLHFPLPEHVGPKIEGFDRHRWVLPFEFELDIDKMVVTPPKHGMMNAMLGVGVQA